MGDINSKLSFLGIQGQRAQDVSYLIDGKLVFPFLEELNLSLKESCRKPAAIVKQRTTKPPLHKQALHETKAVSNKKWNQLMTELNNYVEANNTRNKMRTTYESTIQQKKNADWKITTDLRLETLLNSERFM